MILPPPVRKGRDADLDRARKVFLAAHSGELEQYSDLQRLDAMQTLLATGRLETYAPLLPLVFNHNGKPYHLADHFPFEPLFGRHVPTNSVVKSGRQVSKSTSQASRGILISVVIPYFTTLYVSPLYEQIRRFSTQYVRKFLDESPLKGYWHGSSTENSVLQRSFKNFSKMFFSFATLTADRIRGISANACCFDAAAEVLTRDGWKLIREVTTDDEIADVTDTGLVEWNRPVETLHKRHTGRMVTFRHRGMALRVTEDHKMWVNFHTKASSSQPDEYRFVSAGELADTALMGFKMTCRSSWPDRANGPIELPGVPAAYGAGRLPIKVPDEAFAALVGWYLAEGHLDTGRGRHTARITQNENRYSDEIRDCLGKCGFTYSVQSRKAPGGETRNTFAINPVQFGAYVAPLGKSRDKYIPPEFFENRTRLSALLRALYLGDASYHAGEAWDNGTLRTRSKRLADDTHRAWFALGRPAVVHTRTMAPRPGAEAEPIYEVCAYKRDYQVFWRAAFKAEKRVTSEYVADEEVYCFTVKNHRPVVRGAAGQIPVLAGQCFDEVQDLDPNHLPVIRETMSHSQFGAGVSIYTGTPKTLDNALEYEWQRSSQAEWSVPCRACNHVNIPSLDQDLVGMIGPWHAGIGPLVPSDPDVKPGVPATICAKCGHWIDPREGRWLHRYPARKWDYPGYHVPQLIMPIHSEDPKRWKKLVGKQNGADNYTSAKFMNEVLGESYDVGSKLVTKTDLEAAACLPWKNDPKKPEVQARRKGDYILRVLGVDWGGGGEDEVSFTTGAVLGLTGSGQLDVLYGVRLLTPNDPIAEARELLRIYNMFDCQLFAHDYNGAGNLREAFMVNAGLHLSRVVPFVYTRTTSRDLITRHEPGAGNNSRNFYLLDKARSLQYVCELVRLKWIKFFKYDYVDVDNRGLLHDFLSLVESKTETQRAGEVYNIIRIAAFPDDFAHSVNFAACATWHATGKYPSVAQLSNLVLTAAQLEAVNPPNPWSGPLENDNDIYRSW